MKYTVPVCDRKDMKCFYDKNDGSKILIPVSWMNKQIETLLFLSLKLSCDYNVIIIKKIC